jgi:hypothetical protein
MTGVQRVGDFTSHQEIQDRAKANKTGHGTRQSGCNQKSTTTVFFADGQWQNDLECGRTVPNLSFGD